MAQKIVPFRAHGRPPTRAELVKRVRELMASPDCLGFDAPHFRQRLSERSVSMRQVIETLKHGEGVDGPTLDDYGDWRIKLSRRVAGRRVQVVVAIQRDRLTAITVF